MTEDYGFNKGFFARLRKNPEAALNFVMLKLKFLLELEEKYPAIDWHYQINEILKDFEEESHE